MLRISAQQPCCVVLFESRFLLLLKLLPATIDLPVIGTGSSVVAVT
jgi:hypothetical protein